MSKTGTAKWLPAARETGIIVTGILLALAADAAWENRQDQNTAEYYLTAIKADLEIGIDLVDRYCADASALREQTLDLLTVVESGNPPSGLMEPGLGNFPMRVSMGTLESLLDTGDQRLVGDETLRTLLVTERATINHWQDLYDQWAYEAIERFREATVWRTRIRLANGVGGLAGRNASSPLPASLIVDDVDAVAAYAQQRDALWNQVAILARLRAALVRVDGAIGGNPLGLSANPCDQPDDAF